MLHRQERGENGRYVRGVRASFGDLSLDERKNPFFDPTFALNAGEVFQAKPYVSPDTHEWVISNSTPVPATGSPAAAIVHFEITLESFRRTAAATAGDDTVIIVDADTGAVVVDSRVPQRVGAPLGRPGDRRYASLVGRAGSAGVATVDGYRVAFQRLEETANNANHWYVVASDPDLAASFLATIGWAPPGMALGALALLALAGITFRSSRRVLYDAAHTDALTGLQNRRKLVMDLDGVPASGHRFALALYDLDGFKSYNDSFGHLPGDALLRRLAGKLAMAAGDRSTVYRLGGDEFCMLTRLRTGEMADDAARVGAEALSEAGEGFSISASYGCVVLPDEAQTSADALAVADVRMYARKNASRPSAGRQTTGRAGARPVGAVAVARSARLRGRRAGGGDRGPLRSLGVPARAASAGGRAPRRGQDRDSGRDPRQAGQADRRRVGADARAHRHRRADPDRSAGAAGRRRHRPRLARAVRRQGISGWPRRRCDPARGAHHQRRRRALRDDVRPPVPHGAELRGAPWTSYGAAAAASSTRRSSTRSSTRSASDRRPRTRYPR